MSEQQGGEHAEQSPSDRAASPAEEASAAGSRAAAGAEASDRNGAPDDTVSGDTFPFEMGEFTAHFPYDRHYATNHMWALEISPGRWRFGLTAYAVRLLQDVYFLDWLVEPPHPLRQRSTIGSIESKKAESDLFTPVAGTLSAINDATLDDPSLINADPYGDGWLIEIEPAETDELLSPDGYAQHLEGAWEVAQKTIKGQANQ